MNILKTSKVFSLGMLSLLSGFVMPLRNHAQAVQQTYHLKHILFTPTLRAEFSQFIDNILRQIPSKQFYSFIDTIPAGKHRSDKDLYKIMLKNASSIQATVPFYTQLGALSNQKKVLSEQMVTLLGKQKSLEGAVEIGSPATYISSIKDRIAISGPVYYINDQQRATDPFQAFSFNPLKKFVDYDHFVPLNDYEPIAKEAIADNSVDLVVCFIGLHHAPPAKLDSFVKSIHRILRPGGIFILRDHNALNEDMQSMVFAAHSVFNVIMNTDSLETETSEIRNFRELDYWINLVEQQGFNVGEDRLLQAGDPTLNTMLKFTKTASTEQEKIQHISHMLKNKTPYARNGMQTYLTSPEWLSVDFSQEYGKFVEHTPFYEYPYFQNIETYWKVFGESWKRAAAKQGHLKVLTSPYAQMNLFIGVMTTIEFGAKGLLSLPMQWAYSGEETGVLHMLVQDNNNELTTVDPRIKTIKNFANAHTQLIEVPRYKEFLKIMCKIADTDIIILEIAGNKEIQFKVRYKNSDQINFLPGCKKEFTWHLKTQTDFTYAALTVQVSALKDVIKDLQSQNVEILYIHDF